VAQCPPERPLPDAEASQIREENDMEVSLLWLLPEAEKETLLYFHFAIYVIKIYREL
jgi:hypothetical protein